MDTTEPDKERGLRKDVGLPKSFESWRTFQVWIPKMRPFKIPRTPWPPRPTKMAGRTRRMKTRRLEGKE